VAQVTIMLRRDPQTGKQNIIIKLDSEADALPQEHEQMHRELVEKVFGKKLEDFGEIIVERDAGAEATQTQKTDAPPVRKKEGQGR
jgi:hypothetical protein